MTKISSPHLPFCSIISQVLSSIQHKGFDVKALRAFRVLRPLRLVSRAPSKSFIWCFTQVFCVVFISSKFTLLCFKVYHAMCTLCELSGLLCLYDIFRAPNKLIMLFHSLLSYSALHQAIKFIFYFIFLLSGGKNSISDINLIK